MKIAISPKEEVKLDEDNETIECDNQRKSLGQKNFSENFLKKQKQNRKKNLSNSLCRRRA
jgi:hypothetical protein